MNERTVVAIVGPGHGTDRQKAEVSVVNGHIWMTFLGPRDGRQYTLPLSVEGSVRLGRLLLAAAEACEDDGETPIRMIPEAT